MWWVGAFGSPGPLAAAAGVGPWLGLLVLLSGHMGPGWKMLPPLLLLPGRLRPEQKLPTGCGRSEAAVGSWG